MLRNDALLLAAGLISHVLQADELELEAIFPEDDVLDMPAWSAAEVRLFCSAVKRCDCSLYSDTFTLFDVLVLAYAGSETISARSGC